MVTSIDLRMRLPLVAACGGPEIRMWPRSPRKVIGKWTSDSCATSSWWPRNGTSPVRGPTRHGTAAVVGTDEGARERARNILVNASPARRGVTAGGKALLDGARALLADLERAKQHAVCAAKGIEAASARSRRIRDQPQLCLRRDARLSRRLPVGRTTRLREQLARSRRLEIQGRGRSAVAILAGECAGFRRRSFDR